MNYKKVSVDLSERQRHTIASAINAGISAKIKILHKQLFGNNATFLATPTQYNKIQKGKDLGKGVMITLTKKQMETMKSGGFLPLLLGSLVSSLAPVIFNRIFPEQQGSGFNIPGARGISRPPRKWIMPDNGGNTSYRIDGFTAKNAGEGGEGYGMTLPGTRTARTYKPRRKLQYEYPQYMEHQELDIPEYTKKKQGMGYVNPNSERYQMLV